jgi:hypothetical protein
LGSEDEKLIPPLLVQDLMHRSFPAFARYEP